MWVFLVDGWLSSIRRIGTHLLSSSMLHHILGLHCPTWCHVSYWVLEKGLAALEMCNKSKTHTGFKKKEEYLIDIFCILDTCWNNFWKYWVQRCIIKMNFTRFFPQTHSNVAVGELKITWFTLYFSWTTALKPLGLLLQLAEEGRASGGDTLDS